MSLFKVSFQLSGLMLPLTPTQCFEYSLIPVALFSPGPERGSQTVDEKPFSHSMPVFHDNILSTDSSGLPVQVGDWLGLPRQVLPALALSLQKLEQRT